MAVVWRVAITLAKTPTTTVRLNPYARAEFTLAAKRGHRTLNDVINDLGQYAKFLYPEPIVAPPPEISIAPFRARERP